MSITTRRLALAALALTAFALAGCRSGYDVDIRNMTDHPVVAQLTTAHPDGAGQPLAQTRLGPGDRGSLFSQQDYLTRVWLSVEFQGNEGRPATLDLARGKTVVNVRRTDEGARGTIRLEEVSGP